MGRNQNFFNTTDAAHWNNCGPIMTKRYTIPFLICIIVLILSEYFLLQEAFSNKRLPILAFCTFGLVSSITVFWFFYKQFRKALK
jgi:hypothetical protein